MPNPSALVDADGLSIDPIYQPAGTVRLKAAGDTVGITGSVDDGAPQLVQAIKAGTATHSNVTGANASTSLLAAAPTRKGVSIWNDSTANLYLKYATAASATSCFVKLTPGAYWEMPVIWTGVVYGFWDAVNGSARILELT